jgi:hypothetical protein
MTTQDLVPPRALPGIPLALALAGPGIAITATPTRGEKEND